MSSTLWWQSAHPIGTQSEDCSITHCFSRRSVSPVYHTILGHLDPRPLFRASVQVSPQGMGLKAMEASVAHVSAALGVPLALWLEVIQCSDIRRVSEGMIGTHKRG